MGGPESESSVLEGGGVKKENKLFFICHISFNRGQTLYMTLSRVDQVSVVIRREDVYYVLGLSSHSYWWVLKLLGMMSGFFFLSLDSKFLLSLVYIWRLV